MPKKAKVYELAMSDDEEHIQVKMNEKKAPRKKVERSEESKQAMLKRLEEGRKKAFEVRMKNKAEREKLKGEEQEKTEKVASYLKNEDIFEKKYSSKFEKLEEILSGIDNNFREIKEYKKQKREKLMKMEEQKIQKETESPPTPPMNATVIKETHVLPSQVPITRPISNDERVVAMAKALPNYRAMKFGKGYF